MSEPALSKNYTPSEVEQDIYKLWLESGAFAGNPDERGPDKRYVVMMPLPNVTGALHMGHAMDNVMQDLLIRWHRMKGHNTLWMPGTDHAGIATQAVVEKRLKELENLTRYDLGREGLIERIWKWKGQYQSRIIEQQQKMGCSCDWEKQRFTMDNVCARAVRHNFFRMFHDGLIFRGKRLVNWDVFLKTTISDDEMYYETVDGHFWHLKYPIINPKKGEPEFVIVATTRPETMLGDTAVAVHPDPKGYLEKKVSELEKEIELHENKQELKEELSLLNDRITNVLPMLVRLRDMALDGRKVTLPLVNRVIPLICDTWAQPELGSGCVKITPAHDYNDYDVWNRHKEEIDIINILNIDGTLNENAGPYEGMERFAARDKVVEDLQAQNLLDRIEDREIEIGHSDRSKTAIEPFYSDQWFIRMGDIEGGILMGRGTGKEFRKPGLVQAAMDAVLENRVKIHPERYTKTYLNWLAEKRDWTISRQLWWGHRIPVWSRVLEPKALAKEPVLGKLSGMTDADPLLKKEILIRIDRMDADFSILVEGDAIAAFKAPSWQDEEKCRVDVCLLEDNEKMIQILEAGGFERDPDVLD
ncbi:MAG: class I tRNA ligase family protein, partial [Spirochaetales bacterium]|nr:class I tRNA ligase family protein [Spirochaetales bacterium]